MVKKTVTVENHRADIAKILEDIVNDSGLQKKFQNKKGAELLKFVTKDLSSCKDSSGKNYDNFTMDDIIAILEDNERHMSSTTEQLIFWFK